MRVPKIQYVHWKREYEMGTTLYSEEEETISRSNTGYFAVVRARGMMMIINNREY